MKNGKDWKNACFPSERKEKSSVWSLLLSAIYVIIQTMKTKKKKKKMMIITMTISQIRKRNAKYWTANLCVFKIPNSLF